MIDEVAEKIAKSDAVVFVTGAGLSVASGITPYRKSKDAVWSRIIMDWGTIAKFHEDPLAWWREFWLKAHNFALDDKPPAPNPGHFAITEIAKRYRDTLVVTQNIDGLHRKAGLPEDQLVEIHGRHDRFICTDPECERVLNPLEKIDLRMIERDAIPRCDLCGAPLRPLVLLFDETYDSHPAYNMRVARRALNDAEVMIFVGTSFSVGITDYAIRAGRYAEAMLVNVNVDGIDDFGFKNLLGPAEVVLPDLAQRVRDAAR